jgi:hypothetical protein
MVLFILWMGLRPGHFMAASEAPVVKLLAEAKAPAPHLTPIAPATEGEAHAASAHEAPAHGEVEK